MIYEGTDAMTNVHPTALRLADNNSLLIEWSDGQRRRYSFGQLRKHCPCATCRAERDEDARPPNSLPILSAPSSGPVRVDGMKPVGTYAYSIEFSDGHNTGIYTFELLRQLGEPEAENQGV
jgi:DUF971 family protein